MKKASYILIIVLLLVTVLFKSSVDPKFKFGNTFKIYLVKGLTCSQAQQLPLDKLPLESNPILSGKDISAYYWKSNIFTIEESIFDDRLFERVGAGMIPFVVVANGERIYLGAMSSPLSSQSLPQQVPVISLGPGGYTLDQLRKDGYTLMPDNSERLVPISAPRKGEDKRNDKRIYDALKKCGILKE